MSTYLYEMRVNWDGNYGIVDFDAPEGTIQSATVEVIGLLDSSGVPYTPMYQVVDTVIRVTVANGSTSSDVNNQLLINIRQNKGFQDSTGTFVAGTCTSIASNLPPKLSIDQTQVGVVKFNFDIPSGANGKDGKSAFQIAQDNGWSGSDFAWLQTLKGDSAYTIAKANGYVGTEAAWVASLKGLKGDRGIDGPSGDNAYTIARLNGFVGTVGQWLTSLKGEKGDVGPTGTYTSPYKELAGGTLWYCRPRHTEGVYQQNGYSYQTSKIDSNFVIEDDLFDNSGVFIPPALNPSDPYGSRSIMPKYTNVPSYGIHKKGRFLSGLISPYSQYSGYMIDSFEPQMWGWYYVMLTPEDSAQFTQETLKNIEVDVQGVTHSGYEIYRDESHTTNKVEIGKEKGLLFPVYKGASLHTVKDTTKNIVVLWFRVMTYTQRRNGATTADVFEWDGISPDGWDLNAPEVHWWSTNVAQGMKFTAKVRK